MASQEEKTKQSAKLNRDLLRKHDITYRENPYPHETSTRLPKHVNRLRRILTDFENIICEADMFLLDKSLVSEIMASEPSAFYPLPRKQFIRENELRMAEIRRREVLETCCRSAEKAESFVGKGYKEDHWQRHIEKYFFMEFEEQGQDNCRLPGHTLIRKALDNYVVKGHRNLWTEAGSLRNRSTDPHKLTDPMPDIFFAFAINEEPLPKYRRGFHMDSQYLNFQIDILRDLRSKGLRSSPITTLQKKEKKAQHLSLADSYCFPWLVVEIKHDTVGSGEVEKLFCQAANGASVALQMFTEVAEHAFQKEDLCHIPPVISLTFHGPVVKLWLAYSLPLHRDALHEHRMMCIWEGSIATAWGSLQLVCILENAKAWALRILKPMLAHYLDTHIAQSSEENQGNLDQVGEIEQIVKRAESLCVGSKVEDDGLGDSGSRSSLMCLAFLLQEVLKARNL